MRQHALLVRGGRCTNATHIFVRSVIAKGSWVCLNIWRIWTHKYKHQKAARNTWDALEQRYINAKYVCFVSHGWPLRAPGSRGQRPLPCAAWALEANAGHTPAVRLALEQQAVTMLFLQLNPWISEERHFIFNHLRRFFTRYTALSAEFV